MHKFGFFFLCLDSGALILHLQLLETLVLCLRLQLGRLILCLDLSKLLEFALNGSLLLGLGLHAGLLLQFGFSAQMFLFNLELLLFLKFLHLLLVLFLLSQQRFFLFLALLLLFQRCLPPLRLVKLRLFRLLRSHLLQFLGFQLRFFLSL